MATTTNYGWTTPDDTALVKDGAAAIRTLGSSVDTTTKNLNPETTLGDIAYRSSTANVKTRLGIGTSGQILTVSGGVPAWTTPAAGGLTKAFADVTATESTTSTSYTDLTTAGPAVTLTTGTKVLVIVSSNLRANANGGYVNMDFEISGATTRAADDNTSLSNMNQTGTANYMSASSARAITVTAGSNTFTTKYKVNTGTAVFYDRQIVVIDMGS